MTQKTAKEQLSSPDTWVDEYGDYLYKFAVARVMNAATAEDLVQETFLAALQNRDSFEGRSTLKTWLVSILKHKIIDHIRRAGREQPVENMELGLRQVDDSFDDTGKWKSKPAKWTSSPMALFEQKEFWDILSRCMSKLSPRLARAFQLREMDGLNCDEICNILNISSSNCWVMLYRARMSLRDCLQDTWLDEKAREDF
jgi:RNA polymerase sigma-70 factor (ECF subfamily)